MKVKACDRSFFQLSCEKTHSYLLLELITTRFITFSVLNAFRSQYIFVTNFGL